MKQLLVAVLFLLGQMTSPALAGGPIIPKAVTGPEHAEGNSYWRINHMNLLLHDRDQTMRFGDREVKASLKECVTCHAVDGAEGTPVSVQSDKHFCRVCHDYAYVKVDCFSCHNSKPDAPRQTLLRPRLPKSTELASYLTEVAE